MKSEKTFSEEGGRNRGGVGLAIAIGLLWAAAIGVTWYFYRENDSEGGLAAFFGRFHILVVHLPIGLLFLIPLMEVFGWSRWGKAARSAVPFVLWMAVITAAMASFLGFLMMNAEDTTGRLMTLHMWTGLGVGLFAVLALVFKLARLGPLYALSLIVAIGATMAAGHFGGAMVHSSDYLTKFAPESIKPIMEIGLKSSPANDATGAVADAGGTASGTGDGESVAGSEGESDGEGVAAVVPVGEQVVFTSFVLPILEAKCTECHSEEKIKGKLRLDTHAFVMAGAEGTDYPTVVPGDGEGSELIARVMMPEDDDLFMPPDGKEKLTEQEIEVLTWWIDAGADGDKTVAELQADSRMEGLLASVAQSLASDGDGIEMVADTAKPEGIWDGLSPEEQQARLDEAAAAAGAGGFSMLPISAEDGRLRISAVNAAANFGDEQLAALEPVLERIVWLDAGRTQVGDAGMEIIGRMPNLQRLHLEQTQVTDSGIRHLAGLSELEYLNLYGTEVTAAIFEPLANLRSLRKLFLWETQVDPQAARDFQRQMSLEVNTGFEEVAAVADDEAEEPSAQPEPVPAAEAEPKATAKAEPKPNPEPEPEPEPQPAPKIEPAKEAGDSPQPKTAPKAKENPKQKGKSAAAPAA